MKLVHLCGYTVCFRKAPEASEMVSESHEIWNSKHPEDNNSLSRDLPLMPAILRKLPGKGRAIKLAFVSCMSNVTGFHLEKEPLCSEDELL